MKIQPFEVIEGNLKAQKCTDAFGGPNMYRLHIKNTNGYWNYVQFMDVNNIQDYFITKLPKYKETKSKSYELI